MNTILPIIVLIIIVYRLSKSSKIKYIKKNKAVGKMHKSNLDIIPFNKTAEMLDENIFWEIIDKSLKSTKSQEEQENFLVAEIKKLTPKEIVGFRLRTDKLLYDTYNSAMWCAGYIMNGGCSDDSFEYFRCWVISRGKDAYNNAKLNPDSLINVAKGDIGLYEFESFWYVALKAFEYNTGKNLYDYIDNENFKTREGHYPQIELTWKEEDPDSMKKLCPNLYLKFNSYKKD